MVSSRRRTEAPLSPCSSYRDPWEWQQVSKTVDRSRNGDEQLTVEGEREVARRVLEDLERLYFDGTDDEESEEEDSELDWGSDTSSHSSQSKRTAGGLTLEELTVAVNAAIEYHRPAMFPIPQPMAKTKEDDNVPHYSKNHRRPSQRKDQSIESPQSGESVLEMFQNMLERKEKHFYDLRAMNAASGDNIPDNQPKVVAIRNAAIDQQQQTTAYVRDQATETEENLHHPALDVAVQAGFHSPVNSIPASVHSRYPANQSKPIRPIEVGPTLADLAQNHLRREKHRSSRSASESSWGSSSSSGTGRARSVSSAFESDGIGSSSDSSSSEASSKMSRKSRSSNQSSSKTQSQPRIDPKLQSFTQFRNDEAAPPPPSVASPHVPSNPADVKWELDLSNFSF